MFRELFRAINISAIFFFAIGMLVLLAINGGAYFREIRYALFLHLPFGFDDLERNNILEVAATYELPEDGHALVIPKISVNVPVAIPRGTTNDRILASLEEGVGLYPGSAPFGTEDGRTILLGHSSRASWYRGEYATVFALLPRLEAGDEFSVLGGGKKYVYRVFEKAFLSPARTNEVLAGPSSGSEVDLITCYPIGSASQRTLVRASLLRVEEQ